MLQSTDSERLGEKGSSSRDTWISLGRRKKRDLLGGLGWGGNKNLDWAWGEGGESAKR